MDLLSTKLQCIVVALFGAFIGIAYGFGVYLFPAIAPNMIQDFGFTYVQMGVTTGAAQASFLLFALLSGLLTVWLGPFSIILCSLLISTVSLGFLSVADNFLAASICLIILGGCAASIWVPMVEVSQQLVNSKYQGRALGFMSSGTSYGVVVNSLLINKFLDGDNWRGIWVAAFAIACVFCILALWLFAYLRRFSVSPDIKTNESASKIKMLDKVRSILSPHTVLILFLMFLSGLSCLPYQSYISSFLVEEHSFSIERSAIVWRFIGLTGMVSGFTIGWLGDRITLRRALTIVCSALTLSSLILLLENPSVIQIYGAAIMFGFAFYAIYGLIPAYISHMYKSGGAALVFSLGSVVLGLGGVVGNLAGGWLKEVTGTFDYLYAIILVTSVGATILTLFMRRESVIVNKNV